jgi:hypothetical protein
MKIYKFALASLVLFAQTTLASAGPDDTFHYEVAVLHNTDNRIDETQQLSLSTQLGQRGTFESLTRETRPNLVSVGADGVIADKVEGLSFSILPGYVDAAGKLTSIAEYTVWHAGAIVAEHSHTFKQAPGQAFVLPEIGSYKFIVKLRK